MRQLQGLASEEEQRREGVRCDSQGSSCGSVFGVSLIHRGFGALPKARTEALGGSGGLQSVVWFEVTAMTSQCSGTREEEFLCRPLSPRWETAHPETISDSFPVWKGVTLWGQVAPGTSVGGV